MHFNNKNTDHLVFGWKEGWDFFTNEKILLPAQTLFFTYPLTQEPKLSEKISTGAAAGFDITGTTLRAILEVIERDAFMTMWLTQFPPVRINEYYFTDKKIQRIISQIYKYNLQLYLFDITHDLEVPCFMSVLVDATGLGPSVSVGLKSGFDNIETIIGSLQEALHSRNWIKSEIIKRKYRPKKVNPKNIHTILQRGFYWTNNKHIEHLSFLLNQKTIKRNYIRTHLTDKQSLEKIKKILQKKKYPILSNSRSFKNL